NLGLHLLSRALEYRFVALHFIADLLQPARKRPLSDRFPHLGHHHVDTCHRISPRFNVAGRQAARASRRDASARSQGWAAPPRQSAHPTSSTSTTRMEHPSLDPADIPVRRRQPLLRTLPPSRPPP